MPSSGTGGPCSHCFVTHSCCWRRGPAAKPVLCNACGSRYLVKKSLDGYVPIQQRAGTVTGRPKQGRAPKGVTKPSRTAVKLLDPTSWPSASDESETAYLTDDSAATPPSRIFYSAEVLSLRATHGEPRVLRITTEDELHALGLSQLLRPTMRLKPRKPLYPSISVVF